MSIPEIRLINNKKVLFVDDKPFFMICGEIHNSSSSTKDYLEKTLKKVDNLNLNSILAPITWQQFEPVEGQFDYKYVDDVIDCVASHNLKLSILWFGTWKNAAMSYAPDWIKEDIDKYKRAELEQGKHQIIRKSSILSATYTTLSPFCNNTLEKDCNAFKNLMKHIKEYDTSHTVITIQVENETGILGGNFDYSDASVEEYNKDVPTDLINFLKSHSDTLDIKLQGALNKTGTWRELFGKYSHEVFMAYGISRYVGKVCRSGKNEYNLPMGVNCWLDNNKNKPGLYPCGGPISSMMEIWMYNAPELDVYAPDNYLHKFYEYLDSFNKNNNPIYIPESMVCAKMVSRQLNVVGKYHGICFAGFGIEDIDDEFNVKFSRFAWLLGFAIDAHKNYMQDIELYSKTNKLLANIYPIIVNNYGTNNLQASSYEYTKHKISTSFIFDDIKFNTIFAPIGKAKEPGILINKLNDDEFLILGYSTITTIESLNKDYAYIEYLRIEEGYYKDNNWVTSRVLNGDEESLMQITPSLLKIKLHKYN